jgi:hypothetical protein
MGLFSSDPLKKIQKMLRGMSLEHLELSHEFQRFEYPAQANHALGETMLTASLDELTPSIRTVLTVGRAPFMPYDHFHIGYATMGHPDWWYATDNLLQLPLRPSLPFQVEMAGAVLFEANATLSMHFAISRDASTTIEAFNAFAPSAGLIPIKTTPEGHIDYLASIEAATRRVYDKAGMPQLPGSITSK